jgi:hypothetical protein
MENQETNSETGFTTHFSPLEENVTQRDYTRPNVKIDDVTPIAEPTFSMPSFEELDSNFRQQLGEEDPSGSEDPRKVWGGDEPVGSANPYVENLDKKEQKMASQAMVDAILDGYGGLKTYSNTFIKIPKNKLEKLIKSGEIDPNIMIPLGNNQSVPLMQYVEMYNAETEGTISMSPEWRAKVEPVLLRILMKRNIGMSDEGLLGYYILSDIAITGLQMYSLMNQNKALLNQLKETTEAMGYRPTPASTQSNKPSAYADEPTPSPEPAPRSPSGAVEYFEPEEAPEEQPRAKAQAKTESFTNFEVLEDLQPEPAKTPRTKKSRVVQNKTMPEFGDAELLAHMENVAKSSSRRKKK